MVGISPKILGKSPKGAAMADVAWAQGIIQDAFPKELGNVQQRQGIALDFFTQWAADQKVKDWPTVRRVRALWNQDARRLDAHEKEALQDALEARTHETTKTALAHLQSLRQALETQDADFHSEQINALLQIERSFSALGVVRSESEG